MSNLSETTTDSSTPEPHPEINAQVMSISKMWFGLSIAALLLAGLMSLSFIAGRAPVISQWITDPLWIKRVLVVHVNLALIVFIYSFFCGLYMLIPVGTSIPKIQYLGFRLAVISTLILVATVFIPSASPVLSNYVPVLNHPVFMVGILLFGLSMVVTIIGSKPFSRNLHQDNSIDSVIPVSSRPMLRAAAILLVLAVVVFILSWRLGDPNMTPFIYYDIMMWGGGHILQFVNVATLISVWLILAHRLFGRSPSSYRLSVILSVIFVVPVLFSPLLLIKGTSTFLYLTGFTLYMKWGLFPITSVFIILILMQFLTAKSQQAMPVSPIKNPYFTGLLASIVFMLIGFVVGFMISGSNTLIPAHYHAALGSITIAFMTLTYYLMEIFGYPFPNKDVKKWAAYQPLFFGTGMLLFVIGFGYAGANGMARKTFGVDQIIGSKEALIGIATAGVGGLLAVTGGIIFLIVLLKNIAGGKTPTKL